MYVSNVNTANVESGYAVYVGNQNTGVTMRDVVLFNGISGSAAGHNGLGWYGSDGRADNVYIGYFLNTGLHVLGGAADETFVWHGGGIFTCKVGAAVGGGGAVFDGASFDHCQADGVYINNGQVFFSGCTWHSNSMAANGSNSNVRVAGDSLTVSLVNCRAAPIDTGANNPAYMINVTGKSCTLNLFGNADSGVQFVCGWTNHAGVGTTYNAALQADTALSSDGAEHTLLTSPWLPIGTYLVTATLTVASASASSDLCEWGVAVGSATATLVGSIAGATSQTAPTRDLVCSTNTLTFFATVTVAGTLVQRYHASGVLTALATGVNRNLGQSTGITAIAITSAL